MPECVDLTGDSDNERIERGRKRASPDSDVVIVSGDAAASLDQNKRQRAAPGAADAGEDDDVVLESETGVVALRDMAHARPQCGNHAFRQGVNTANSQRCGECYCFVCDIKAQDCQYWGIGSRARDHCNAHTSHYWNSLRKAARKGGASSAALLQQEFNSSSTTLTTNWSLPGSNSNSSLNSAAGRRAQQTPGGRGKDSPLVTLWARQQSTRTPRAPAAAGAGAAAAAAAGGTPPPAAAAAAAGGGIGVGSSNPAAVKKEGVKPQQQPQQQQQQQQQQQKVPRPRLALPPASTWLQRIPHPAQLNTPTQLLVRLELPFKAVKGVTVDEVAARLVATGFYRDSGARMAQYGEHLLLDNISSGQYVVAKRKEMPNVLKLLPLLPADGLPVEPERGRPCRVLVISTSPGVKPLELGVVVPSGSKLSKITSAVEEQLAGQHGYSSSQEGLLLGLFNTGTRDDAPPDAAGRSYEGSLEWYRDLETTRLQDVSLYTNRHNTWLVVRVPAAVAQDYYKPSTQPGVYSQAKPKVLLLSHEMTVALSEEEAAAAAAGAGAAGAGGRWGRVDSDDDSDDMPPLGFQEDDTEEAEMDFFDLHGRDWTETEEQEWRDSRRARAQQRQGQKHVGLGVPMAVLVPEGMTMAGGAAADKAVREAVVKHLVAYRAQGGRKPSSKLTDWKHLVLHRSSGATRQRLATSMYSTPPRDFSVSGEPLWAAYNAPGVRMWVDWGSDPVPSPPGFDMAAFSTQPQLDDPAFEQRLQGLPELLKASAAYASTMKMLKTMPYDIMRELQSACAVSVPPPNNTPQAMAKVAFRPSAAVVLSVIKAPGSSSGSNAGSNAGSNGGGSKGSSKGSSKKPVGKGAGSSKAAAAAGVPAVAAEGSSAAAAIAAASAVLEGQGKAVDLDRLGVLQVEVYVFTTSGRLHARLFEDYDDWGSSVIAGPGRSGRFRSTSCSLTSVLNARLLQEPGGYRLLREVNELGGTHAPAHGIAKLMEWVAAGERPAAVQPEGLTVTLHPYQLQSLKFMQEAENWEGGWRHLLWKWLPPTPTPQQQQQQQSAAAGLLAGPSSSAAAAAAAGGGGALVAAEQQQQQQQRPGVGPGVWWSPVLGRVSSAVPPAPWGGFLAEEMGLGKTVEVLGLILSNLAPPSLVAGAVDPESGFIQSRGTLVVCAVSLVGQWCTEASKKLNGSLKMYPYHGQNRIRNKQRLATEFDIVVTTYATLGSDFGGKKNQGRADSPLGGIKWHRIVFDEGHTVKNMTAAHSKACTALASDRRWICTGTPINTDISDLLGQFNVLHMQPFATKSYFDAYVKHAFASYGYGVSAVPLLYTLRHTMIRHTKAQSIQGQSVLALPDKSEELVPVVLSPAERTAYLRVHREAADVWAAVRRMSSSAINQKLLQVMSLLQPLRRICSGGRLTPNDLRLPSDLLLEASAADAARTAGAAAMAAAASAIFGGGDPAAAAAAAGGRLLVQEDCSISVPDLECPICLDAFDTPVMTLCHHWYCKECILGVLSSNSHCPLCRGPVTAADLRAPGKKAEPAPKKKRKRAAKSSSGDDTDSGTSSDAQEGGGAESDADAAAAAAGGAGPSTRRSTRGGGEGDVVVCESKLRALLAELTAMRARDPTSKALVFSQYSSTLEWLKQRLPEEGFGYRTITGSMPLKQRSKAIEAFQGDPPTTVFLLSIWSGAVGINLTAANHVFLLEPCVNPALEEQAIGRAWRMGQTRPVVVKRFYVKGSIEERIMDVRNIRQGHASHSAGAAAAAAAAAAEAPPARMGRKKVAAAELAGNLQADRQVLKIAELDLLFRTPELDSADGAGSSGQAAAAAAAAAAAGAGSSGQAAAAAAAPGAGSSGHAAAAAAGAGSSGQAAAAAGANSSGQAAAAAAAAGAGSSGQAAAAGAGSSEQAAAAGAAGTSAAAAAAGEGFNPSAWQQAADAYHAAVIAAMGGGGCSSMGPPADRLPAAAAAAAAGGEAAAAAAGGEAAEGFPDLPVGSQEARELAAEAGLQSSQEMTPYLLAQLQQQKRAWQRFEQRKQQEGEDGQQ